MAFLASLFLLNVGRIFVILGLVHLSLARAAKSTPLSRRLRPGLSHVDYAPDYAPIVMRSVEKRALFDVMEAMASGRNWSQTHPDPCGLNIWHGLECEIGPNEDDTTAHVVSLAFGFANGVDPNPACKSDARIPQAIERLIFLENLIIFECFQKTDTTLPSYLGKLTSLQVLDIRSNVALVGQIPPELGNLTNLQVLALSTNKLEGKIPDLGNLQSLQNLDLSYNMLNGSIPSSLGRLTELQLFNLRGNQLGGDIPSTLGKLINLQKLDVGMNALEGDVPSSIGNSMSLTLLSLDNNKLTGGLPESFGNLVRLQYLLADNNEMSHPLPEFWGKMKDSLTYASLSNSSYNGSIPESLSELRNITHLALDSNELTGEIPESLEDLDTITFLNLSRNFLSGVVPFSLGFVTTLGHGLSLDHNPALCEPASYAPAGILGLDTCPDDMEEILPFDAEAPTLSPTLTPPKSAANHTSSIQVAITLFSIFVTLLVIVDLLA